MRPRVDEGALQRAAELAIAYLDRMPDLPVREEASLDDLRASVRMPLNDAPIDPTVVVDELARDAAPGLVQIQSPRYFGFVIGGSVDAAIGADWLASAWDQNAGGYPCGPSAAVVEEAIGEWIVDLLGLPPGAGVGLTTGCQMAHFTCLAAARNRKLAEAGWGVESDGLFGPHPCACSPDLMPIQRSGRRFGCSVWGATAPRWSKPTIRDACCPVRSRAACAKAR